MTLSIRASRRPSADPTGGPDAERVRPLSHLRGREHRRDDAAGGRDAGGIVQRSHGDGDHRGWGRRRGPRWSPRSPRSVRGCACRRSSRVARRSGFPARARSRWLLVRHQLRVDRAQRRDCRVDLRLALGRTVERPGVGGRAWPRRDGDRRGRASPRRTRGPHRRALALRLRNRDDHRVPARAACRRTRRRSRPRPSGCAGSTSPRGTR